MPTIFGITMDLVTENAQGYIASLVIGLCLEAIQKTAALETIDMLRHRLMIGLRIISKAAHGIKGRTHRSWPRTADQKTSRPNQEKNRIK